MRTKGEVTELMVALKQDIDAWGSVKRLAHETDLSEGQIYCRLEGYQQPNEQLLRAVIERGGTHTLAVLASWAPADPAGCPVALAQEHVAESGAFALQVLSDAHLNGALDHPETLPLLLRGKARLLGLIHHAMASARRAKRALCGTAAEQLRAARGVA